MNIAIIDNYHFEVTHTLISLFDKGGNKITIFVHAEAYSQLQYVLAGKENRYNWIVKKETESYRQFVHHIFRHIKQHHLDLLYFNTIEDNFILYAYHLKQLKNIARILTLHDINGFFHYQPSLSVRRLVRYLGKRKLLKTFPAFNVLSETLIAHLQPNISSSKKIFNIPGSYFSPASFVLLNYNQGDILQITIPGSVDSRRRDYDKVFELLRITQQKGISIFITLLGCFSKGNSENIRQMCRDYLQTNNNLRFYNSPIVDQPEFDQVLSQSHFIWTPLQPSVNINDGVKEQYGVSTCSGNIADAIRHAKPFFIPATVPVDSPLEKSCIRYNIVDEIVAVLTSLTVKKYTALQEQAYQASLNYTKEQIINKNQGLFL